LGLNIPTTRCLSSPETVRDFLRLTAEEVAQAVDGGVIPFAWDLRSPGADRSEMRLWHPTCESLIRSSGTDSGPRPAEPDLARMLIPDRDVRSSELERWWSVSHQHVQRLIAAGLLPVRRSPAAAAGPASYHLLTSDGLRAFLASRRLTVAPITVPGT
jgi:hypothetical protein